MKEGSAWVLERMRSGDQADDEYWNSVVDQSSGCVAERAKNADVLDLDESLFGSCLMKMSMPTVFRAVDEVETY